MLNESLPSSMTLGVMCLPLPLPVCLTALLPTCLLQDFHARYYHPSNARFWFYGDDPPEERLALLARYLDEFEKRTVDSTVKGQPQLQVVGLSCLLCVPLLQGQFQSQTGHCMAGLQCSSSK